ncbi:MAG: helix-turn-helix domain-containing protein [Synergistaceae bacterium]|nr:helix-turn-helix domain-containing protein [Synergistaceae bacterium]MBR1602963.1 helix-turn-helix domain-containing protein [Synergistaceae bacterium]
MATKDGAAERLKFARKKAGLTQEECADLIGVSIMTIRRWEWGERTPRVEELKRLAKALNVDVNELLNGPADTKARFEIIFNKELWEGEDIDMTGNLFSLLLSSDGHIGIKGANKFNSEDEIMDFCIKAAEEMQRAFRAQRERGALAGT